MKIGDLITAITDRGTVENPSGPSLIAEVQGLMVLRNVIDAQLVDAVAGMERLGIARKAGGRTRNLLIEMGFAPTSAMRLLRLAGSIGALDRTAHHLADGALSVEHVDAVVRGVNHIESRSAERFSAEQRSDAETRLLAHAFTGTPADVKAHARSLGNQLAQDDPAVKPAGEDRSLNTVEHRQGADGRLEVRADLDLVVGEKFVTLIDAFAQPRPEPDGSPDRRTAARRRADALETLLDRAAGERRGTQGHSIFGGAPKTEIMMTVPVDTPDLSELQWLGPISRAVSRELSCDAGITEIVLDGNDVPLDVGRSKRLCPAQLRKAVIVRDGGGCIKCGAPAAWAHIHHMRHWSDGGPTSLDNLCVLCPACHADVHALGWEVELGHDRHPWLIPPASVDPNRRPLRAHHRRRMHIEDLPAAA